ncbi:hypothetical protein BU23DRAFT_565470 [Bimuria novae-zelandiae CBS 107.79]|uniref:Ubiquitin 3 binding protein But2 C-terminal domain-containing protein n=1 Tax=Bimuria novae-zelandiae CBS 107.79 TaxID=1447943 RepID=A0A6A5VK21_9PLEO|nr:hypothetical protein BU23DRAFT_565470 [Bimuria novae-zelandiae CBS 107.79]
MVPLFWALAATFAAAKCPVISAYSPGAPRSTESPRSLSQCSSEVPPSDVRPIINVIHHATSTFTLDVTTVEAETEYSTSIVIMIGPSETQGLCESTATVVIPTTTTVMMPVKSTTVVTFTPVSTKTVYSTSWITQNSIPSFFNGPIEDSSYGGMGPSPGHAEPSYRPLGSPQPRSQASKHASAYYSRFEVLV